MALMAITPHFEDVHNFLSHCHKKRYSKGTTTIYEGDECDTPYYMIEGSVSVILEDEDGKEVVISYINAGDFSGGIGLLKNLNSSAPGIAREPTAT